MPLTLLAGALVTVATGSVPLHAAAPIQPDSVGAGSAPRALLARYCVTCHNQRQLTCKSPHEALTTCGDTSEAAVRPANPMANATSVPITMNQGQPRSLP